MARVLSIQQIQHVKPRLHLWPLVPTDSRSWGAQELYHTADARSPCSGGSDCSDSQCRSGSSWFSECPAQRLARLASVLPPPSLRRSCSGVSGQTMVLRQSFCCRKNAISLASCKHFGRGSASVLVAVLRCCRPGGTRALAATPASETGSSHLLCVDCD